VDQPNEQSIGPNYRRDDRGSQPNEQSIGPNYRRDDRGNPPRASKPAGNITSGGSYYSQETGSTHHSTGSRPSGASIPKGESSGSRPSLESSKEYHSRSTVSSSFRSRSSTGSYTDDDRGYSPRSEYSSGTRSYSTRYTDSSPRSRSLSPGRGQHSEDDDYSRDYSRHSGGSRGTNATRSEGDEEGSFHSEPSLSPPTDTSATHSKSAFQSSKSALLSSKDTLMSSTSFLTEDRRKIRHNYDGDDTTQGTNEDKSPEAYRTTHNNDRRGNMKDYREDSQSSVVSSVISELPNVPPREEGLVPTLGERSVQPSEDGSLFEDQESAYVTQSIMEDPSKSGYGSKFSKESSGHSSATDLESARPDPRMSKREERAYHQRKKDLEIQRQLILNAAAAAGVTVAPRRSSAGTTPSQSRSSTNETESSISSSSQSQGLSSSSSRRRESAQDSKSGASNPYSSRTGTGTGTESDLSSNSHNNSKHSGPPREKEPLIIDHARKKTMLESLSELTRLQKAVSDLTLPADLQSTQGDSSRSGLSVSHSGMTTEEDGTSSSDVQSKGSRYVVKDNRRESRAHMARIIERGDSQATDDDKPQQEITAEKLANLKSASATSELPRRSSDISGATESFVSNLSTETSEVKHRINDELEACKRLLAANVATGDISDKSSISSFDRKKQMLRDSGIGLTSDNKQLSDLTMSVVGNNLPVTEMVKALETKKSDGSTSSRDEELLVRRSSRKSLQNRKKSKQEGDAAAGVPFYDDGEEDQESDTGWTSSDSSSNNRQPEVRVPFQKKKRDADDMSSQISVRSQILFGGDAMKAPQSQVELPQAQSFVASQQALPPRDRDTSEESNVSSKHGVSSVVSRGSTGSRNSFGFAPTNPLPATKHASSNRLNEDDLDDLPQQSPMPTMRANQDSRSSDHDEDVSYDSRTRDDDTYDSRSDTEYSEEDRRRNPYSEAGSSDGLRFKKVVSEHSMSSSTYTSEENDGQDDYRRRGGYATADHTRSEGSMQSSSMASESQASSDDNYRRPLRHRNAIDRNDNGSVSSGPSSSRARGPSSSRPRSFGTLSKESSGFIQTAQVFGDLGASQSEESLDDISEGAGPAETRRLLNKKQALSTSSASSRSQENKQMKQQAFVDVGIIHESKSRSSHSDTESEEYSDERVNLKRPALLDAESRRNFMKDFSRQFDAADLRHDHEEEMGQKESTEASSKSSGWTGVRKVRPRRQNCFHRWTRPWWKSVLLILFLFTLVGGVIAATILTLRTKGAPPTDTQSSAGAPEDPVETDNQHFITTEWMNMGTSENSSFSHPGDAAGASLSLSGDGKRLALGASKWSSEVDGRIRNLGVVSIFDYVEDAKDGTLKPQIIAYGSGGSDNEQFGCELSLNEDGSVVVIGSLLTEKTDQGDVLVTGYKTRIFEVEPITDQSSRWLQTDKTSNSSSTNSSTSQLFKGLVQVGKEIITDFKKHAVPFSDAMADISSHGLSLSLNALGDRVVIGAPFFNGTGAVFVYELGGEAWEEMDQCFSDLSKPSEGVMFGAAVAISANGEALAVGSPKQKDGGQANVFKLSNTDGSSSSCWKTQHFFGTNDIGETEQYVSLSEDFGASIDLNSDGSIIVVGAPTSASVDGGEESGFAVVFEHYNDETRQLGKVIHGKAGEHFAHSISLSSDGSRLVAGAPQGSGSTYVYQYSSDNWLAAPVIESGASESDAGFAVSMSGDGSTVVVGMPYLTSCTNMSDSSCLPGTAQIYQDPSFEAPSNVGMKSISTESWPGCIEDSLTCERCKQLIESERPDLQIDIVPSDPPKRRLRRLASNVQIKCSNDKVIEEPKYAKR